MARRENGTGSVYQRKDGRWVGTIEAGWTRSGSRRRISVSGKTRADVQRKLRDKRREIQTSGMPSASSRTTVKKYAAEWLEGRRTKVRASPWATDASALKVWIIPTIGHKRLADLTPADIRAVSNAARKAGRTSSTRLRTHITLTAMLRDAMIDGHQVPGRVLLVEGPSPSIGDREAMSADEITDVLGIAYEYLPHWSRWLVQTTYGQRPAEVRGLTWDNVDFERGIMICQWQLQRLPLVEKRNRAKGYVIPDGVKVRHLVDDWHLTEVKSKKGERILPMIPLVKAALEQWRAIAPASPHGLVWPAANGRPSDEKDDLTEWYALQATACVAHPFADRHYYIYEARHAFATRLMEAGVDETVITALMGHSSIVVSRGYMHADVTQALAAITATAGRISVPGVEVVEGAIVRRQIAS